MSIISKETWDNMPQEEKEKIRKCYEDINEEVNKDGFVKGTYRSLFPKEAFQPKPLTYDDVVRELFPKLREGVVRVEIPTFSEKEAEKLHAIGRLLATAKYLNGDWNPDWENNEEPKWYLCDFPGKKPIPCFTAQNNSCIVYFRTQQLAQQAIQILGEDTVRVALTSEY